MVFWFKHGVPGHSYGTSRLDPEFGAMPREYSYNSNGSLNNLGFRNTEDVFDPKPAGSLRVIAYGGSSTYCHDLSNDEAWPLVIQQDLRALGGVHARDQVLNGGVIMWSIGHIYAKARRDIPRLHPDVVLIYSGVNEDFNAALLAVEGPSIHELVSRHEYGRFTKNLSFNSPFRNVITYKWARDRVSPLLMRLRRPATPRNPAVVDPDVMENYLQTVRELIQFLRANGVRPVFVRELYAPMPGGIVERSPFSPAGAERAAAWGAEVVDPRPILRDYANNTAALFQDTGIHLTAKGAVLLAGVIITQIFAGR